RSHIRLSLIRRESHVPIVCPVARRQGNRLLSSQGLADRDIERAGQEPIDLHLAQPGKDYVDAQIFWLYGGTTQGIGLQRDGGAKRAGIRVWRQRNEPTRERRTREDGDQWIVA